jgi:hypothetical protein
MQKERHLTSVEDNTHTSKFLLLTERSLFKNGIIALDERQVYVTVTHHLSLQ